MGEIFPVKALITHVMETGLRRDDLGEIIPRKIINKFVCRYAGVEVFSADLHESVAANPLRRVPSCARRRAACSNSSGRRMAARCPGLNTIS